MYKDGLAYMALDDWKLKAADGDLPIDVVLCKTFADTKIKADGKDRRIQITLSTKAVDRDNDTIDPEGWDIRNYKKNPVVLWAHDYRGLPVARAVNLIQNNDRLSAVDEFVPREVSPFADTVFELLKGRFLNTSSVGFRPRKSVFNEDRRGFDFSEQELLEHSIVPVPSNPQALVEARSQLGADIMQPMIAWCEEALDTWNGEKGIWVPRSKVEEAFLALETKRHYTIASDPEEQDHGLKEEISALRAEIDELKQTLAVRVHDTSELNDFVASAVEHKTTNAPMLAELDPSQLRSIFREALSGSIDDAIKREITATTGRLVD